MKKRVMKKVIKGIFVLLTIFLISACNNDVTVENANQEKSDQSSNNTKRDGELETVTLALSPFQDVYSIYVGVEKGIFEAAGIELDVIATDWAGGNDLLVGDQVNLATASDTDVVLQNANGVDTTMAFPIFYFAGGALMFDSNRFDWKNYEDFLGETDDTREAMRLTLEQAKGAKIGLNTSVSEYTSFISMLEHAGLDSADYELIDMLQEDIPPALLSGSIDIMISGIPQRLAVQKEEGYETLIDQTALPHTISHNGFAAKRSWIEENKELSLRLLQAFFDTLDYIEKHPDESFTIIAERMKEVGTEISPQELFNVWNIMEYFPNSPDFYRKEMMQPDGRFYWKDRFESVVEIMESEGKIEKGSITDLELLHYTLKLVEELD